jgi:pyruvate/2-oxoglutarate dehydrogenase complex dihydrolipoamide dehydrogenase (E3) component
MYTDPEIASVGKTYEQLKEEGVNFDTYIQFFEKLDRALVEGTEGIIKIFTKDDTDEILGAIIASRNAGDLIS